MCISGLILRLDIILLCSLALFHCVPCHPKHGGQLDRDGGLVVQMAKDQAKDISVIRKLTYHYLYYRLQT